MLSVKSVSNLLFEDDDEKWLMSLYKNTSSDGGFRLFYISMIENALLQESSQKQNVNL